MGESIHTAANCHFQQSPSGCGCGLVSAALHHSQPSCARTNTTISAPRMPRRPPLHPPPGMPLKKIRSQKRLYAPIFFFFIAAVPSSFLKNILSASLGVLVIELTPTVAALENLSQPATPQATLTHFEIRKHSVRRPQRCSPSPNPTSRRFVKVPTGTPIERVGRWRQRIDASDYLAAACEIRRIRIWTLNAIELHPPYAQSPKGRGDRHGLLGYKF